MLYACLTLQICFSSMPFYRMGLHSGVVEFPESLGHPPLHVLDCTKEVDRLWYKTIVCRGQHSDPAFLSSGLCMPLSVWVTAQWTVEAKVQSKKGPRNVVTYIPALDTPVA